MNLRTSLPADSEALAALFTASVHALGAARYDERQRFAWAPVPPDLAAWRHRLAGLRTILAEADGVPLGFVSFTPSGHIEMLYTAPAAVRRGVATALFEHAVAWIVSAGEAVTLSTESSLVAEPFFSSKGFRIVATQEVTRRGVVLRRYAMSRPVAGAG